MERTSVALWHVKVYYRVSKFLALQARPHGAGFSGPSESAHSALGSPSGATAHLT